MCSLKREVEIANNIWFQSSARSELRLTNSPLKRRQLRFIFFVIQQNESLEHLSLHFCCLAGSANKDWVSSIARTLWAMKGKEKMKHSINQSTGGKQTFASEMKGKRHNLGTESCLTGGDESGDEGQITVYSI